MTASLALPISLIFFGFSLYNCICNAWKCSYTVKNIKVLWRRKLYHLHYGLSLECRILMQIPVSSLEWSASWHVDYNTLRTERAALMWWKMYWCVVISKQTLVLERQSRCLNIHVASVTKPWGTIMWLHAKCLRMSDTIFQYYLMKPDIGWTCASCAFTIEWFFVCRRLGRWITQNYLGTWSQSTARFARENGITKYYGKVCDGARPRYLWNVKLQSLRKHFNKDLQMVQININRIQNKF